MPRSHFPILSFLILSTGSSLSRPLALYKDLTAMHCHAILCHNEVGIRWHNSDHSQLSPYLRLYSDFRSDRFDTSFPHSTFQWIYNQMESESITPFHKLYKRHVHSDNGRVSMLRQVWSDIEKDLLGGQKLQGNHQILPQNALVSELVLFQPNYEP